MSKKISFISTVFNEQATIKRFLDSLYSQTEMPDEIIIVDGASSDDTFKVIKNYFSDHASSKTRKIVVIKAGNRSVGRNEAVRIAQGDIIVCSDSGNILDNVWIKNITKPFTNSKVDVVAGYYDGIAENIFQKCVIPFALVMPDKVNSKVFLPATRSLAFRKEIWEEIGRFNETLSHNEDYVFARKLRDANATIVFAKDAIVHWIPRNNLKQVFIMLGRFAFGDAQAGIIRPKVIFVFIRYFLMLLFLYFIIRLHSISGLILLLIFFVLYIYWSIIKNYKYVKSYMAIFYLPLLQFTADAAVLTATSLGLIYKLKQSISHNK